MIWHKFKIPEQAGVFSIDIAGKKLCLVYQSGQPHIMSSKCPHAGADLSQGWCEEGKLICPFHRHAFDIRSGRGNPGQGNYIKTYPTKEENGIWYVGIVKPWWHIF
ncbi:MULTISPECIES: Rieske (2Fe-2S) protein [Sphingobacterium]|uniref:Rieske (2Fe-2S) protein n=1 Tax=Sphingobacterium populi TaxID=1812824 RepID=A0ABW5UAI0_9SPHI|nr:Rieske 2Fe-2S domain-containing protein [Sphingobacterium sp. CFCC 11742]